MSFGTKTTSIDKYIISKAGDLQDSLVLLFISSSVSKLHAPDSEKMVCHPHTLINAALSPALTDHVQVNVCSAAGGRITVTASSAHSEVHFKLKQTHTPESVRTSFSFYLQFKNRLPICPGLIILCLKTCFIAVITCC